MQYSIILTILIATTIGGLASKISQNDWQNFKKNFSKVYDSEAEEVKRMVNFFKNLRAIEDHNKQYSTGGVKYRLGLNEYSDMSQDEFIKTMNGVRLPSNIKFEKPASSRSTVSAAVSDQLDWRQLGAVTGIKNQGACGSCWAFSAVGALEGQHFIKKGVLPSLSEQNLVDCARVGCSGCKGGWPQNAFTYISQNNGIDTEVGYPYTGVQGACVFDRNAVGATDSGYQAVGFGDEEALKEAVYNYGPISIAVDGRALQQYQGGIFEDPNCSSNPKDVTHAMLVIGYGTENGEDYWLIKNSYGTSWGENGYLRLRRNLNNHCSIASYASYPIVY